jgi:hypothetical protein
MESVINFFLYALAIFSAVLCFAWGLRCFLAKDYYVKNTFRNHKLWLRDNLEKAKFRFCVFSRQFDSRIFDRAFWDHLDKKLNENQDLKVTMIFCCALTKEKQFFEKLKHPNLSIIMIEEALVEDMDLREIRNFGRQILLPHNPLNRDFYLRDGDYMLEHRVEERSAHVFEKGVFRPFRYQERFKELQQAAN